MPSSTTTFNVLMLGARAAGKTTMLALMFEHMDSQLDPQLASIRLDIKTASYFADAMSNLRRMFQTPDLSVGEGIEGNAVSPRRLQLDLCTPSHANSHLRLNFLDYAGEFVGRMQDAPADLQAQVKEAHCCFVIIDTPALMEQNGRFHQLRNLPDHVSSLLRFRLSHQEGGPIPVVLIATKAEKYVQQQRQGEVIARIQKEYAKTVEMLQRKYCSVDVGLVETLGTIVFTEFRICKSADGQEFPLYQFRKLSPDAQLAPRFITYPLQVILRTAVNHSINERRKSYDGYNWLRDLFDRDAELRRVLQHLNKIATQEPLSTAVKAA